LTIRKGAECSTSRRASPRRSPRSLKPEIELKDHQREGVRWLLNLWRLSPPSAGGCSPTIWASEDHPAADLHRLGDEEDQRRSVSRRRPGIAAGNWREEIGKFFKEGSLPLLTLYGPDLAGKRVPKDAIEKELVAAGVGL
jgi:SNF2 family DNA or RNA helicase